MIGLDEAARTGPLARIAFICTANRARSPFAASLLERHAGEGTLAVESYGTLERSGDPALLSAIRVARSFGIDLRQHRARALAPGGLRDVDLAIGFEPFHAAAAVVTGGAPKSRTFLLHELAQALEAAPATGAPGASLASLLAEANARRHLADRLPSALPDPVGRSERRFLELYNEIDRLVEEIAARLFGTTSARD